MSLINISVAQPSSYHLLPLKCISHLSLPLHCLFPHAALPAVGGFVLIPATTFKRLFFSRACLSPVCCWQCRQNKNKPVLYSEPVEPTICAYNRVQKVQVRKPPELSTAQRAGRYWRCAEPQSVFKMSCWQVLKPRFVFTSPSNLLSVTFCSTWSCHSLRAFRASSESRWPVCELNEMPQWHKKPVGEAFVRWYKTNRMISSFVSLLAHISGPSLSS